MPADNVEHEGIFIAGLSPLQRRWQQPSRQSRDRTGWTGEDMGSETRGRTGPGRGPLIGAVMVVAALGAGCSSGGGSAGRRIPHDGAATLGPPADRGARALHAWGF